MRPRVLLAALVLAPLTAIAQESPPADADSRDAAARWSLGAGVLFTVGLYGGAVGLDGLGSAAASLPHATASLERRLAGRTWLVLGASGAVTRARADVPAGGYGYARDDGRRVFVTAGVRRPLTGPRAPAEVSLLLLAEAGVADTDLRLVSGATERRQDATAWLAGANAGIAVDRVLTGGLSLRVASPLVAASYERERLDEPGQPRRHASGFVAQAVLAPRLELRLAF